MFFYLYNLNTFDIMLEVERSGVIIEKICNTIEIFKTNPLSIWIDYIGWFVKIHIRCVINGLCIHFSIIFFLFKKIIIINTGIVGYYYLISTNNSNRTKYTFQQWLIFNMHKELNSYLNLDINPQLLWYVAFWVNISAYNICSLLPKTYSLTTILIVPLFFSFWIFFVNNFKHIAVNTETWFLHFFPGRLSNYMAPVVIYIEFISFCIRPFSLSIRLFANILSGHILVHIFSGYGYMFLNGGFFFLTFILTIFLIVLNFLEYFIAIVQSCVFILISVMTHQDTLQKKFGLSKIIKLV